MGWIDEMLVGVPVNAVLRERLTLEAEKRGATIAENVALKSENMALRSENEVLKSQAVNLRQEIQRRDDVIQKEKSHSVHLEEVKEKILVFVAGNKNSVDEQIAQAVGVGVDVASFHLEELRKTKMVSNSHIAGSDWSGSAARTEWFIAHDGRAYLIAHGLIA